MEKRILYVDDDDRLRKLVVGELAESGYVVSEADNGLKAIEALQRDNYDLLLLDINMPGKTGLDVLRFVKEKSLKCRTIMLTGRLGFGVATQSLQLGADEYITKPFTIEYLLEAIQRSLAK